ncbi:MAG TPA: sulfite exporter TauE/SafE family protein, partial [Tepidisphaeraceae bacterium]|nr:sulfite exporter TauE/SafE family protein [Tepidisphaeraceae bacterium]
VLLHVMVVLFVATLIRSAFGFGEALIAVPLLALRIPVAVAAPLAVLMSITVAVTIIVQDWRQIHVRSAVWLVLAALFGIPLGLLLLVAVDERIVKGLLALVIVSFSAYCLLGRNIPRLKHDHRAWLLGCGFLSGILGGAYGMNGPPLIVYGTLRRWSPQHFRATLQGYFLPASMVVMIGYWFSGLWVPAVTQYYIDCLPATILAIVLGRVVNRRMSGAVFLTATYIGLIAIGILLFAQAVHR